MKKSLVSALTTALVVGAASTTFAAANPFSDVPSGHWAYDAVAQLAQDGVIDGYGDNTFQGDKNITRYEMAQMVAKAMAKSNTSKVSGADQALVEKLKAEFSDELNNLGVRVSALENKVGNVKLTGDARIRYRYQDGSKENDNSWDYRVRLRANAQVNDRTKVQLGVSTDSHSFADNGTASNGKTQEDKDIFVDLANVDYNFGGNNWDLLVGRYNYKMGGDRSYGFLFGDTFDGAQLKYQNDKFAATAGYGKFKAGDIAGYTYTTKDKDGKDVEASMDGVKTGYGELEGFFGGGRTAGSAIGVYYNDFTVAGSDAKEVARDSFAFDDAWGAYGSLNLGKWNLLANYEKYNSTNSSDNDPEVWVGKLTYGAANFATPKSWDAWVEYLNADQGFADAKGNFVGSTDGWRADSLLNNVKSWGVGVDYTFAKNAQFQVMQSFASSAKDGNADPGEETRAQFVFVF